MRAIYLRSLVLGICLAALALIEAFAPRASAARPPPAGGAVGGIHRPA